MRAGTAVMATVVAGLVMSACATQPGDPAADRARHFYAAIAAEDGSAACADLASEARKALEQQEAMPCAEAIIDQDIPQPTADATVQVFGSMAQVAYANETAFLSRYDEGWLLTAVGCPPVSGDKPHDCAIEVG